MMRRMQLSRFNKGDFCNCGECEEMSWNLSGDKTLDYNNSHIEFCKLCQKGLVWPASDNNTPIT